MALTASAKESKGIGDGSSDVGGGSLEEEYILKWTDHKVNFFSLAAADLFNDEDLTDVTICCGEKLFDAHKLILSVCSPYFKSMLTHKKKFNKVAMTSAGCSHSHFNQMHPIIFLKDVTPCDFERLLQFMYYGEVRVPNEDLESLILTAKSLKVKGLAASALPPPLTKSPTTNITHNKHEEGRTGQRNEDTTPTSRIPHCSKHKETFAMKHPNHTPPKKRRISASALQAITTNNHHEYDNAHGDENVERQPPLLSSSSASHQHLHHMSVHYTSHHHRSTNFLSAAERFLQNRDHHPKIRGSGSGAPLLHEMTNERILQRRKSPSPIRTAASVSSSSASARPMTASSFSSSLRRHPLTPPPTLCGNAGGTGSTLERKERLAPIRHSSGHQLCSSKFGTSKSTSDLKQSQSEGKIISYCVYLKNINVKLKTH